MSCCICGSSSVYAQNMARTATYCSRECHSKAIDLGIDDRQRWLSDPIYRAAADRSAAAVHDQVVKGGGE